ncbi:hypothetical protein KKI93_22380 [Xenorhabdus bovienii]|uniref:hypothetical protein n=2 Tax=Xenorhabdus bovienii TaxID=40576 RepID=UPI0023B21739|nr:hypothetical protein [Xenorhabdus bovienii]MDE9483979.1 hypothetical protein [Xenorhabdus bovienii]MDE9553289.1 hypothetical protein [Xenorhabdus bovienii]MDE9566677.1 hypothetical protein [Xenorhabdus bovienii]
MKYILSTLMVGGLFFSCQAMSTTTCNSGTTPTGVVKSYGLDSSGKYTQIQFTANDGTNFPQLINKTYPIDTDSGKAIDKIVMLAYVSGAKITIYCVGGNQFSSVKVDN